MHCILHWPVLYALICVYSMQVSAAFCNDLFYMHWLAWTACRYPLRIALNHATRIDLSVLPASICCKFHQLVRKTLIACSACKYLLHLALNHTKRIDLGVLRASICCDLHYPVLCAWTCVYCLQAPAAYCLQPYYFLLFECTACMNSLHIAFARYSRIGLRVPPESICCISHWPEQWWNWFLGTSVRCMLHRFVQNTFMCVYCLKASAAYCIGLYYMHWIASTTCKYPRHLALTRTIWLMCVYSLQISAAYCIESIYECIDLCVLPASVRCILH